MRALLIPLMMVALTLEASNPEKMIVVVRTMDKVIVDYACTDPDGSIGPNELFRSQIASNGALTWHVVGGTAPYTVLKDETNGVYGGCITVQDANGQVATACGVIGVVHKVRRVNCHLYDQQPLDDPSVHAKAPGNKDTCTVPHQKDTKRVAPTKHPAVDPTDGPDTHVQVDPPVKSNPLVTRLSNVLGPITSPAPPPPAPEPPHKPDPVVYQDNPTPFPTSRPGTNSHRNVQNGGPATTNPVARPAVNYRNSRAHTSHGTNPDNGTYRAKLRSN